MRGLVVSLCLLLTACVHPHVYTLEEVTTRPRLQSQLPQPRGSHTAGVVIAECVVKRDGTVSSVRIVRSHDSQTDQVTIAALKQAKFTPAQRAGKPVDVRMLFTMNFTS